MISFGHAKPAGLGHIHIAESEFMHHQFRLSILQWNPGTARRNPTQTIAATCGRFHAAIFQEASDSVPHITDQPIDCTGNTTQVGTHPVRSATTGKRSASIALVGTHNPVGADPRAGTGRFPKPRALVLPMVKFVSIQT